MSKGSGLLGLRIHGGQLVQLEKLLCSIDPSIRNLVVWEGGGFSV